MIPRRFITTVAATGILVSMLTGCAVSLADTEADTTADQVADAATEPQSEAPKETPAEAEEDTAPEPQAQTPDEEKPTDSGPTEWSDAVAEARDQAIASVSKTVTCDGELVLGANETGQIIRVDGACAHLVLDLHGGFVVAGETTTVDLRGVGNLVFVDAVTTLNSPGDANELYWLGATPAVNDTGVGNVLTAG